MTYSSSPEESVLSWSQLVENYYDALQASGLAPQQRDAIARIYQAAKLVSLEGYQGDLQYSSDYGDLARLVYTTCVEVPYAAYGAAHTYLFDWCLRLGVDYRSDLPTAPSSSLPEFWIPQLGLARDWQVVSDAIQAILDGDDIGQVEETIEAWIPMALEDAIQQLETVIGQLSNAVQAEVSEVIDLLDRVGRSLDPMESQFLDTSDPFNPRFPFIDRTGESGLTVFPSPDQADVAVNLDRLDLYPNLFDLICAGFHFAYAYLGADRLPRPYYPAMADPDADTDWQINSIADAIGQLHSELREISVVDSEVRSGVEPGLQPERIQTNLGTALGLVLAAIKDLSLDSERNLAATVESGQGVLTALAQLGGKTQVEEVDLGWRGKIPVPVATGASLAQQIHALEILCSAIALQLGVSLRPQQGG